jgi:hypothetical protein
LRLINESFFGSFSSEKELFNFLLCLMQQLRQRQAKCPRNVHIGHRRLATDTAASTPLSNRPRILRPMPEKKKGVLFLKKKNQKDFFKRCAAGASDKSC